MIDLETKIRKALGARMLRAALALLPSSDTRDLLSVAQRRERSYVRYAGYCEAQHVQPKPMHVWLQFADKWGWL